jgi:hypothetical protein
MTMMSTRSVMGRAGLAAVALVAGAGVASAQGDAERVAKNKQTILSRVEREPLQTRGDKPGQIRLKWEWYNKIVASYQYEKRALVTEQSAGEKHEVRPGWVFKDMKVTFGELFQLGAEHDDKLMPIIAHDGLLEMLPSASLAGVTLLNKSGEVKGAYTRKLKERGYYGLSDRLEYKDNKDGKLRNADIRSGLGFAYDAVTVRWKDIKDKVVDEVSAAKALEDLKLQRDALFPEGTGN